MSDHFTEHGHVKSMKSMTKAPPIIIIIDAEIKVTLSQKLLQGHRRKLKSKHD